MTTFLDRLAVDRITHQARDVHFGRTLLTLLGSMFFALGWLAFKVAAVLWLACVWCAVAVREGWRTARGVSPDGKARTL